MSTTTDLGRLHLSCSKTKLQLALDATITTSTVHNGTLTSQHLHSSSSDYLVSRRAWFHRGVGLCLELDIAVDGKPLDEEVLELLKETVCQADLWGQLHLHAYLTSDHSDADGSVSSPKRLVRIKLDHDRLEDSSQKTACHLLSSGASCADVKPPDGVEQVALEAISLKMRINKTKPSTKKRRSCLPIDTNSELFSSQEDPCFESLEAAASSQSSLYQDDVMLLEEPLSCASTPNELLWDEKHQAIDISSHMDAVELPCPLKRTAAALCQDGEVDRHLEGIISSEELTQLVDAALRLTICARPSKLPPGVKLKKADLVGRLSEFAPALFSPNYLPAISQRAVFLPTIAHALSHSLYKNARSATLRSKIDQLASQCSEDAIGEQSATESASHVTETPPASNAYQSISVKLWHLMQRELFDGKAARRLKPLKVSGNAAAAAKLACDDLLDDLSAVFGQEDLDALVVKDDLLDWADDEVEHHSPQDDLLFETGFKESEEFDELEEADCHWDYEPAELLEQWADCSDRLFMPIPRRHVQLSFTDSGIGEDAATCLVEEAGTEANGSGSKSTESGCLEAFSGMGDVGIEPAWEWMQDETKDADVIMSF